jgi:hypothetical protein
MSSFVAEMTEQRNKTLFLPVWITNTISQLNTSYVEPFLSGDSSSEQQDSTTSISYDIGHSADDQALQISQSNEEISGLVSHAKTLANQLQDLVQQGVEIDLTVEGRQPTYDELVEKLSHVLLHQRDVNEATSRMTATNYVVNMVNFVKNKQLKSLVNDGRRQLQLMGGHVVNLEKKVVDLNSEVAVQKKTSERFKSGLDATRNLLEKSISEYRQELTRQNEVLRRQQRTVSDLFKSRFNQDFILDSSIFGASFYLVNTMLVDYPIQMILWLIALRPGKRQAFVKQFLKLVCCLYAFKEIRAIAMFYGLHHKVGGISHYAMFLLKSSLSAGMSVFGKKNSSQKLEADLEVGEIKFSELQTNESNSIA